MADFASITDHEDCCFVPQKNRAVRFLCYNFHVEEIEKRHALRADAFLGTPLGTRIFATLGELGLGEECNGYDSPVITNPSRYELWERVTNGRFYAWHDMNRSAGRAPNTYAISHDASA